MKNLDFIIKSAGLLLIGLFLAGYQNIAVQRSVEAAAHQEILDEVEAYNASVVEAIEAASREAAGEAEAASLYVDGVYEGSAMGFGGNIHVAVTVENGDLTEIEVLEASAEDPAYYEQAVSVIDDMLKKQSTDVDTVSGATFSSTGIINAAATALEQAVN